MSNTNSTPSFLMDSILDENIKSKQNYTLSSKIKNNNQQLFYSHSYCETQSKLHPLKISKISYNKSDKYLKKKLNYNSYYSPNVFSYYNQSYQQSPKYDILVNNTYVNESSKPLLSHSTSVVNLSNHKYTLTNKQQSPKIDSNNITNNKVILSEECYLKLLESHKFSEQFKNGILLKKRRKQRTIFTKQQTDLLESVFNKNEYITLDERSCLSKKLQISEKQVKIWFQNRRNKLKKINSSTNMDSDKNTGSENTDTEDKTNNSINYENNIIT